MTFSKGHHPRGATLPWEGLRGNSLLRRVLLGSLMGNILVTPTTNITNCPKALRYKCEAYCDTNQRSTESIFLSSELRCTKRTAIHNGAIQIGGVLRHCFSYSPDLRGSGFCGASKGFYESFPVVTLPMPVILGNCWRKVQHHARKKTDFSPHPHYSHINLWRWFLK